MNIIRQALANRAARERAAFEALGIDFRTPPTGKEAAAIARQAEQAEYEHKIRNHQEHLRPERIAEATPEQWIGMFEKCGEDVIYNAIACGHTVASFARERGYPLFYFHQWCSEHLDRKKVIEAKKAAADLAAYDSAAIFDDPSTKQSMQAVHHTRAKAQHLMALAERKDAENWGPPKTVAPQQAPMALIVSIDGGQIPAAHHARIAEKRAEKLRLAEPVFDPKGIRSAAVDGELADGDGE